MRRHPRAALVLAGILLGGLALRLHALGDVPLGFHPDEGHNALDALRIAEGWRPVFLPGNNGREPLFMYAMAAILAIAGPSIWAARLTGVVAGVLVIAAQARWAAALPVPRPRLTACASAALVAFTFWPVAQARYALRAGLLPAWVALMLWAWWRALDLPPDRPEEVVGNRDPGRGRPVADRRRRRRLGYAVLAGVFLAAAIYTHLTGRLLPLVLVVSALWTAARWRVRWPLVALAVALATAAVLALPQAAYFAANPEMLAYRADQVSVLNPEVNEGDLVGLLAANAASLATMANLDGDSSWYHNVAHRPVFDLPAGLAFLAGALLLARALADRRRPTRQAAAVLIVASLAVGLVPSWLSVGAPNYVRLTATWPALFLLPAWGLGALAERLDRPGRPLAGPIVAGLVVLTTASSTWYALFGVYAAEPQVYEAFNGAAVERGVILDSIAAEGTTYVAPELWRQAVIRFLTAQRPPTAFDPGSGLVLPPDGDARYAFDPAEREDADAFGARWPQMARADVFDSRGGLSLVVFRATGPAGLDLPTPGDARTDFGGHILLEAAAMPSSPIAAGDTMTMTLVWRAEAPTPVDMNLFVHVIDASGRTIGQHDGPPLDGSYPTSAWRPGERIVEDLAIPLAADAPAGPATIRLGWYDWRTGERLPIAGDDDAAAEVRTVTVGGP